MGTPVNNWKSLKSTLKYYRVNSNCITIVNETFGQETVVLSKFYLLTYCIYIWFSLNSKGRFVVKMKKTDVRIRIGLCPGKICPGFRIMQKKSNCGSTGESYKKPLKSMWVCLSKLFLVFYLYSLKSNYDLHLTV